MKRALFGLTLLLAGAGGAFGQAVPPTMNFQGRLAKPDGTPVPDNAAQSVTFRLYSSVSGGTLLWSQTLNVSVHNGTFATALNFAAGYSAGYSQSNRPLA